MGFVTYISLHLVGAAAKISRTDNTFVVAQGNALSWLIALAANEFVKTSFSANDDIHETLSE